MHKLKQSIRLIVFDLDGTLVDAYAAIISSFNYTMHTLKYPKRDAMTIKRAVGWGDEALLRPFADKKDLKKAVAIYRRHHRESLLEGSRLIQGARYVLEFLKKKGYNLAVASNRPRRFSLLLMRHLNIHKYFDFVLCGDELTNPKPNPQILIKIMKNFGVSRRQTLYVGDMHVDVQTANRAKVKMIAVLTGSSNAGEIKKERPYRLIKGISYLPALLRSLQLDLSRVI